MKLHVQLFEAKNLRPRDRPCHAYARLKLGNAKCKSAVCANDSPDPCWFEDFVFNVDDLGAELQISVWHKERFADVFLGRLRLPVSVVLHADRLSIASSWYPLQIRSKWSKTPVTGEIRAGFILSGRTSSSGTLNQSSDVSYSSSVNSTPESSLPRTSSADSFLSMDNAPQEEISVPESIHSDHESRDSTHGTGPLSHFPHLSAWLPGSVVSFFTEPNTVEVGSIIEESDAGAESSTNPPDNDEELVAPSFFEDDGTFEPSSDEDLPAPLAGGILLTGTYAVTAKALNGILFGPGSPFLKDLFEVQKSTELYEGPWKRGELNKPKRVMSYVKAATKLVKSVKATEDQTYSRADNKGFVVVAVATTPDAPYGRTFRIEVQYCIFARMEKTAFLQISWGIHFISSTMMKGIIESGARQGLQDSFKDFEQVLTKYAKPAAAQGQLVRADVDASTAKSDWQLAKEYFCNLRVLVVISSTLAILLHVYLSKPCPKSGLEVWKLDFPDTLREFITSAMLGVHLERIFATARKFIGARLYKVSDHGVKAKGNGWLLAVTLVGAKNLPASIEAAPPDPFVVFTCTGRSRTSSVKLQSFNPKWEEKFEFDATEEAPSTMNVEVFHFEGPFTEAESVGHAEINFLKQTPEELANLWVPLEGKDALAAGSKIHLRIVLMNTKESDSAGQYIEKVEKEVGRKITKRSFVKNASFQKLFSLPSEEFLVNDFTCSLKRKFLLQGRIFLSPRVLAFYSNIFGHKTRFMLLWDDIEEIKEASPALGSMGILLNPTILVFTKKGRAMDAYHAAKSVDSKGRLKFQFQSFIRYTPAYRTMMVLWNERTLSPEQRLDLLADIEQENDSSVGADRQTDDTETFLGFDEAKQTEVYSTELPLSEGGLGIIDPEMQSATLLSKLIVRGFYPVYSSIGKAPSEIVEGGKKVPPILHTKDQIFEADKYVQDMDEMYKKVKVALEKTRAKQKKAVDCYCREVVFSLGDWVLLGFEKARLKLPENWKIHNAFHVSLLRPYVGDVPEDMPAEELSPGGVIEGDYNVFKRGVSSLVCIYEKENLDEKIAEKTGHLNYFPTPWESTGDNVVEQRRVTFKLSNQISLFGTNVTCIQQKTKQADGHAFYIDEVLTLHDVPFGDNFQIQVRKEMVDIAFDPPASSCKVFVGVAWHKSTLFQNQISKNIFERYTKLLKDVLDVSVKELLQHKDEAHV
ncbi:hypothetical protein L7F22_013552 [Adiantum nelumboides]|nr:hypothetical protein [Adiantum nelumboides]